MTNKIPFSDYREIIEILQTDGSDSDRYYDLFRNKGWHDKYFKSWRGKQGTWNGPSPESIYVIHGLKGFVKIVLEKYKTNNTMKQLKLEVGQKVWSIQLGECEVTKINDADSPFPYFCKSTGSLVNELYSLEGKLYEEDVVPSLFLSNPFVPKEGDLSMRKIAEKLWDLLDKIDTLSDICKPTVQDPKAAMAFYNNAMKYAENRFEFMKSDGNGLFTNEEFTNLPKDEDMGSLPTNK